MTGRQIAMDGPMHLGLPLTDPDPVPGCKTCQHLAGQRDAAKKAGDPPRVSDCNVWIRRHPSHEHKIPRW
ncbi:hypothetical protein ACFYQA_02515 [Streptomyces sp. NPDC005774]|uniref:hypothetical protein n=1 Tax=Streptomyces TaxID=1883 RepID=UPI0036C34A2C